jgi:hypothetical protein
MTTSNSIDFSVNRDDLITAAMRAARIIGSDVTPGSGEITTGAQALNLIVKQWQGVSDFAPGLKVWSRKRAYLFLNTGTSQYSLGPSGDHWTTTLNQTTISAAEAAGQTVLSVTSTTGMTAADNIGIELDSGALQWTTIVSTGAGPVVTVTTALTGAAAAGNRVYWYTTKARRPLNILTAVLRDSDNTDAPLAFMNLEQYQALPDKTADGDPTAIFYEGQLTNGQLYTDVEADDVTKQIYCVFLSPIEDFDVLTDTPDYPQEWFRALKYQLAMDLAPEFGRPISPDLKVLRDESLVMARQLYADESRMHFEPGRD